MLWYSLELPRRLHKNISCGYSLELPRRLHKNICCGYSLESPRQGNSYEYPQHMFLWGEAILMSTHNICFYGEIMIIISKWAAPGEFGTYRLFEQRRFRRACASAQSRQNLCCSLIQAVSQEEPSDGKPDP